MLERRRGLGLGPFRMEAIEAEAQARGTRELGLNDQEEVLPSYEGLGYTAH